MSKNSVIVSVFSNWASLVLAIGIAFFVTPILVTKLGDESYGIWVIIVSLTGYFTVLDLGVNSAIVRFISKYAALKDYQKAAETYSSSFALFSLIGAVVMIATSILAVFFKDIFDTASFSRGYLFVVFFIVGVDLALNLIFSVLMGTLKGLQRFFEINVISMSVSIVKNILIVYCLYKNYSLLMLATLQILASILRFLLQYLYIKKQYRFLIFSISSVNKETLRDLYSYSIYSFLIAIAWQVLFLSDSIVIGSLVSVSQVTYFAIPAMIADHLEKLIWAIVAVLIPIISSQESIGQADRNRELYLLGTKYTLLLLSPVIFVLFLVGKDFISMWMGSNYATPSGEVLRILLIGHAFFLAQLVAHGILKGISRHRILAFILCAEAGLNIILSVLLAPTYGIKGVAFGTIVPMLVANIVILPYYTCRVLQLNYFRYLYEAIVQPLLFLIVPLFIFHKFDVSVSSYFQLILFSLSAALVYGLLALFFQIKKEHANRILSILKLKKVDVQ